MAYQKGNRDQLSMLPPTIEEYVSQDDPVRAYDAFIDALDMEELGLSYTFNKVGHPAYDPKSMLKLLIYGYSYGWRSSRKLERALHHNLSFIWLVGGIKPDHKTIANFRRNNPDVLKKTLKLGVQICIKLGMIEGNSLFVDGTKIRGNVARSSKKNKKAWKKELHKIDERIEQIMEECEKTDQREHGSLVAMDRQLAGEKKLKSKIEGILQLMKDQKKTEMNGTDPDAVMFRSRQGSHAGFNAQLVTDEKHGLIVHSDVVSENTDLHQFAKQIDGANETLEKNCVSASADAGYSHTDTLKQIDDQGIQIIVPSQKQALRNPVPKPFEKAHFRYIPENNEYRCPEDKILRYSHYSKVKKQYLYRMKQASDCRACLHFGVCTTAVRGRSIIRLRNEVLKEQLETQYASEEGQNIYARRKCVSENPFGHIKANLHVTAFLLRGLKLVGGEFAIMANSFNIVRMITLSGGVKGLIQRLQALPT